MDDKVKKLEQIITEKEAMIAVFLNYMKVVSDSVDEIEKASDLLIKQAAL